MRSTSPGSAKSVHTQVLGHRHHHYYHLPHFSSSDKWAVKRTSSTLNVTKFPLKADQTNNWIVPDRLFSIVNSYFYETKTSCLSSIEDGSESLKVQLINCLLYTVQWKVVIHMIFLINGSFPISINSWKNSLVFHNIIVSISKFYFKRFLQIKRFHYFVFIFSNAEIMH